MFISLMTGPRRDQEVLVPFTSIVAIEKSVSSDPEYPHRAKWREPGSEGAADVVRSGLTSDSELQSIFLQAGLVGAVRFAVADGEQSNGLPVKEMILLSNGQRAAVVATPGGAPAFMLLDGGLGGNHGILDEAGLSEVDYAVARSQGLRRHEAKQSKIAAAKVSADV